MDNSIYAKDIFEKAMKNKREENALMNDSYETLVAKFAEKWYNLLDCPTEKVFSWKGFLREFGIGKSQAGKIIRHLEKRGFRVVITRKFPTFKKLVRIVSHK